jgi:hypothetical protein
MVLQTLTVQGWEHLDDVARPGRSGKTIDHVLVGPPGIFVLDVQRWKGRVRADRASLQHNGRDRANTLVSCCKAARDVSLQLSPRAAAMVRPVVCIDRDEPLHGWAGPVMICSAGSLWEMATSQPTRFSAADVAEVIRQLRDQRLVLPAQLPAQLPARLPEQRRLRALGQPAVNGQRPGPPRHRRGPKHRSDRRLNDSWFRMPG